MLRFAAGGLIALILLALGSTFILRDTARREATRDAEVTTELIADAVIGPMLRDTILESSPAAVAVLERGASYLPDGSLARIKLWRADGTIVYSDEHRLIGQRFDLDADDLEVLEQGGTASGVSDLSEPENRFEPPAEPLVEVYTRVETPNGTPLLLEAYYRDADVSRSATLISRRFIPIGIGALIVFAAVQIPLGIDLARRTRAAQRDRERLLRQAIEAQTNERRRIAADLHDGIVQDLVGVSLTVSAAAGVVGDPDFDLDTAGTEVSRTLHEAAKTTRHGIQQLRTLLVDIYPPNLREAGLPAALRDLLAPLANAGVVVDLTCDDGLELSADEDALFYRFAHEGVRNALRHANATRVELALERINGSVMMTVRDDGRGFELTDGAPVGHFGLRSLADVAAASRAELRIDTAPGRGTTLRLAIGGHR